MTTELRQAIDTADASALRQHLERTDTDFMPVLSSRVDLPAYATKLASQARRVELWQGERLVGLVAIYCNAPAGADAFITSVSLERAWRGQGWADRLIEAACTLARAAGLARVRLELHCDNQAARRLYERHGFIPAEPVQQMLPMHRPL